MTKIKVCLWSKDQSLGIRGSEFMDFFYDQGQ